MPAPVLPKSLAPNRWFGTATRGATLRGSNGARDQLSANTTGVTLVGGAMDDTYVAYDVNTKITEAAGGGIDTVLTYGHAYTLEANVENLTLMGRADSTATGNGGDNILSGNSGDNRITTGGGNDVLVGSGGADTYVATKEAGSITWITRFKATGTTIDKVDVRGFGLSGFESIRSRMSQIGADVQIDLGSGQKVMLESKTVSELSAANFLVEAAGAGSAPSNPTPSNPTPTDPAPSSPPPTNTGLPSGLNDLVLTFADEFNTLNLYSTWKPTDGWGNRTLVGNKELELYVDPQYKGLGLNPFSVKDGILTITAEKASSSVASKIGGYQYTSGMLSSHASFSQQYGYFEVRAQMTTEQGMWPAFWMLATHGKWPPELDVVEVVGKNPNAVVQSVHTGAGSNSGKTTWASDDLANGFHTYGMDWTASTITFYFDGKKTHQVATPADMHTPMYMLLNLAVGGTWPGSPDGTTDWSQANLKVDYVHAYKHDPNGASLPNPPTQNPPPAEIPPSTETPPPTTDPVQTAGMEAVISNAMDARNLTDCFTATVTGASSSSTYGANQLQLAGQHSSASVNVTYDDNCGITVVNKGIWNAVKNATIKSSESGSVTVNNFVDAEIALGDGGNTVTVTDAKRGSITTGSGNDKITVTGYNNSTNPDAMNINAGGGNDAVSYSGAANTKVAITTGSGSDTITVSGKAGGTIAAGGGDDRIVIDSTGTVKVTGGSGADVFEFIRGAHATISDFNAAEDRLVLNGVSAVDVKLASSGNSTLVDLGDGSSVILEGVAVSASALGLGPDPITAVLSNAMDSADLTGTFTAEATGANTSTTYNTSQLKLDGMDPYAKAMVTYDAENNLTVANKGIWNGIKNARVESAESGSVTVNNFVDARVSLGNGDNTVTVTSAKRGSVTTGAGNDEITVTGHNNSTHPDAMTVNAGGGNNTIGYSGASNTKTAIATGGGADMITISGKAAATVNAGAGNDHVVIGTSGAVTATGGAGQDVFEFIRGAHATISDFNAAEDSIVVRGGSSSTVQVKAGSGYTMVDLGNGASVTLAGVTTPTSSIHIAYA